MGLFDFLSLNRSIVLRPDGRHRFGIFAVDSKWLDVGPYTFTVDPELIFTPSEETPYFNSVEELEHVDWSKYPQSNKRHDRWILAYDDDAALARPEGPMAHEDYVKHSLDTAQMMMKRETGEAGERMNSLVHLQMMGMGIGLVLSCVYGVIFLATKLGGS